jgi:hypothetical protein
MTLKIFRFPCVILFGALLANVAQAGIFNAPHFIEPGKMSIGVEPELTTSDGAGLAGNLRYTLGIADFMDAAAIIGTGSGPLRFRLGGDMVFDFFPDVNNQPGIGLLTRVIYYKYPVSGELRVFGAPYIHKAFVLENKEEVEPYIAIPLGVGFDNGTYHGLSQFVIGSMFKNMEQFRYNLELGINMSNVETYISGGITYYP